MQRRRKNSPFWEYLEKKGVLEKGTDEEIKAAKREYKKIYLLDYKRKQREKKPEFTISFSKEKNEYQRVEVEAKRHKLSMSKFIKEAALAYISKTYIVPDRQKVAELEQILSQCLNEVQRITRDRFDRNKLETIEKRIEKLQSDVDRLFRNPLEAV